MTEDHMLEVEILIFLMVHSLLSQAHLKELQEFVIQESELNIGEWILPNEV